MTKDNCKITTASIILNGGRLNASLLRSRISGLPLQFNIVPEILAGTIRQEKVISDIQIGKEEEHLLLFEDDRVLYIENPN